MMSESTHIALVVDEYGGTEGVVTMEDFIETLLGLEIVDEVDRVEDMQEIARRQWERRAQRVGLVTDNLRMEDPEKSDDK
jgi:CBS domain containing-hemolysin-like protein